MKLNKDLIMRKIAGEVVLIPTGKMAQQFNGMITMNPVAEFIWENIEKTENVNQLVDLIVNEFEVEREIALNDALGFVTMMIDNGFITND